MAGNTRSRCGAQYSSCTYDTAIKEYGAIAAEDPAAAPAPVSAAVADRLSLSRIIEDEDYYGVLFD